MSEILHNSVYFISGIKQNSQTLPSKWNNQHQIITLRDDLVNERKKKKKNNTERQSYTSLSHMKDGH